MSNEITDNVFIAESRNMNIKQNTTPMYNIANQSVIDNNDSKQLH